MTIYFVILSYFAVLFAILKLNMEKVQKDIKKLYSLLCFVILFLIMGLRAPTVGADIGQYLYKYNNLTPNINSFISELDIVSFLGNENGFTFLNSILKTLHFNNQQYIMFFSFIFAFSFIFFYYKYSKNIFISILLFITIGNFAMSMTGLRQTLAIVLTLYSFKFIFERKLIKFLVIILMAMSFHFSSIIFLPVYFLYGIILKKRDAILVFCVVLLFLPLNKIIYNYFFIPFIPQQYTIYMNFSASLNPLVVLVALSINFFPIFFWDNFNSKNDSEKKLVSFLFIGSSLYSIFNILALNLVWINRLSFYFMPFNELLIPLVLYYIKSKETKQILTTAIIMLVILHFVISTPGGTLKIDDYLFFNQVK